VKGSLRLKGARKRPWLEIRRPETERGELSWQLRCLQELHDGPLEWVRDRVPSDGFYDMHRLRIHGEGLYRAYELLCPRDERQLTPELLDLLGDQVLAVLWSDVGKWSRHRIAFSGGAVTGEEWSLYDGWLRDRGFSPKLWWNHGTPCRVRLGPMDSGRFKESAAPHLHYLQRRRLLSRFAQAVN